MSLALLEETQKICSMQDVQASDIAIGPVNNADKNPAQFQTVAKFCIGCKEAIETEVA